jgi:NADH:ubiquinone oxidoreductase subunit 6 (subunit J)
MSEKTGGAVIAQSRDNSLLNTEPAVVRGAVISIVGALATLLVVGGVLDADQKRQLEENAGTIAVAVLVILPILQAVWTRFSVWSGKTVAEIAVENAHAPVGAAPTLAPPP